MIPVTRKAKIRAAISENKFLLAAFLIPLLIMWLIYIALEVYPFGNNSVLVLDLNGQYVYFFEELRHKILNGGSFLYTWSRSLGGEFMGIFAYYLSSPLSFLIALFPENHITEFLLILILTKVGLMGTTMAYYLNKLHPTTKLNVLIFSTCYALSSYAVVMIHNIMWFDNLILLPLLALGIEKLISERKFKLFVVCLSMSLLTSFYIGYMTCIFVIIYFFYYYLAHNGEQENNLFQEENHFWKSFVRIAFYSLIAICIAMIIIYPAYTSLQFGKSTFSTANYTFDLRFDILDFITKLFPGSYDTVRPAGLPFVYCGVLTLIMVPMYFITSRIRWQERMMGGVILLVLFICFSINAIDIVWHGFQKPNWLNYRYSYMFIFLMLVMAYKAFGYLKYANYKHIVFIVGSLAVILIFIQKQDYKWVSDLGTVGFGILCLGVFCVVLWLLYSKVYHGNATAVIAVLVCIELFSAGLMNTVALDEDVVISSRVSYNSKMEALQPVVDQVKEYDKSPFYRMEKNYHRKTNDAMRLGFYGISNSTSTLNKSTVDLLHKFGYTSKSHWSKYLGGTPVSDALLGIKYSILTSETDNDIYEMIAENETSVGDLYTYYNPCALSLAFASNEAASELQITDYESPFELMNELVNSIVGSDEYGDVFSRVSVISNNQTNISTGFTSEHKKYSATDPSSVAELSFDILVPAGKPIYMCIPTDYPRECDLYIDGLSSDTYFGDETDCVKYIGKYDEEQTITVTLRLKEEPIYIRNSQHYFYALEADNFKDCFEDISAGNLEITSFEDTLIKGKINVPENRDIMFTSIPFDEGWQVYIDGKRTDLIKTNDSLLAVPISQGEHDVELKYLPKCFTVGAAVSVIGVVAFIAAIIVSEIKKHRVKKSYPNRTEDESKFPKNIELPDISDLISDNAQEQKSDNIDGDI